MIVRDKTEQSRGHRFYRIHKSSRVDASEEITLLSKIVDDWKQVFTGRREKLSASRKEMCVIAPDGAVLSNDFSKAEGPFRNAIR
ncbi:hypothetical protein NPIL_407211 [Nephila pilipes]|uniref:Uncharacterized protein n=1 Tax=Nephila pilipes TaxID=299642 RepID=A0A8X6PTY4_NEPPI|nr:hypothetical protein NPIL_407211 [Nephila pilipes]